MMNPIIGARQARPFILGETLHISTQVAGDILSMMDVLKIDKAHVLGNSLSSHLGVIMASKAPDRIQSLALISPMPPVQVSILLSTSWHRTDPLFPLFYRTKKTSNSTGSSGKPLIFRMNARV
jgi:pimeloyl-ACP methyl ester carboxylesterase